MYAFARWSGAAAIALTLCAPAVAQSKFQYPQTKSVDHKDTYHGTDVVDPYRWLENDVRQDNEVKQWVDAQNKVTFGYLEKLPYREAIKQRLTEITNFEKQTTPFKAGGRYYFQRNDGLQNQYVLYVQNSLADEPRVLIDPNKWSKDGTVALEGYTFSEDGRYIAYAVADAGSDWRIWRVMEIDSGKILPDEIRWVKFAGTSWTKDSAGFFYGRYPEPEPGAKFQSLNKNMKMYYHRIGTSQADDVLVFHRPDNPEWSFGGYVTEDGRYLLITIWQGTDDRYRVYYKDLKEPYGTALALVDVFENEYSFIGNNGPIFYFKTNVDAPRGRVIAMDIRNPEKSNWKEIIPHAADLLNDVDLVGNLLVADYLKDARSAAKVYTMDGKFVRDVELPGVGTVNGFGGKKNDPETFYSFSSFTTPPTIYRYDVGTGERKQIYRAKVKFNSDDYEVKQVFYNSKDGTRVPMFIAHRKGLRLDGSNPTLLYGYGGFNISLTPSFSTSRLVWMQLGGVLAIPNLRGGGEYGEDWHKAGTKLKKQNVFDDFISAGEYLVRNKYTSPKKLAIQGGSNGGLLVGAAMTQRPDLFAAALPAVGVMDMLRFHKFTAGRFWVDDYGSADNAEEFKALRAYSPYHNLKKGTSYPATLVTTADTDDRVVPGHSFKFAAALQQAHSGPNPVLIRIETRAGHGAGKPLTKQIEETADVWSFLVANLGMQPPSDLKATRKETDTR